MEKQVQNWLDLGLSQEDSTFLAMVQQGYVITLDADWEQDVRPEKEFDKGIARQIRKEMDKGNVWAWCSVKVSVSAHLPADDETTADDYLGGCSYKDRNDFIVNSGYFVQMVRECYESLKQREPSTSL